MSQEEKEKDSKDVPKKEENRDDGELWMNRIALALCVIACLFIFAFCTGMCSHDSGYDDRWDRLEHNVKSDPYYHQWD